MASALSCALVLAMLVTAGGCTFSQAEADDLGTLKERAPGAQGGVQSPFGISEEQPMRKGVVDSFDSPGDLGGAAGDEGDTEPEASDSADSNRFRNTEAGEPVAVHQFLNQVIVDDEHVKITIQSKTADELGDAGFMLIVENRYKPLTSVGRDNYCYITPVMGTWTVNGVPIDPRTEDKVYPGKPGSIYLYFDELSSIEQLVDVKGTYELFLISDWWNPVGVYEFSLS